MVNGESKACLFLWRVPRAKNCSMWLEEGPWRTLWSAISTFLRVEDGLFEARPGKCVRTVLGSRAPSKRRSTPVPFPPPSIFHDNHIGAVTRRELTEVHG